MAEVRRSCGGELPYGRGQHAMEEQGRHAREEQGWRVVEELEEHAMDELEGYAIEEPKPCVRGDEEQQILEVLG